MAMVDADGSCLFRRTHSPSWLAWWSGVAANRRVVCIHQMNRVNSRNGLPWWQHH